MPLLIHSLVTSQSDEILESTITTVLSVCDQNKDIIQQYVETLLPRIITLVNHQRMKIRIASLKCLTKLAAYPLHMLVPLQKDVIRAMRSVLDDRKRLVRKEAVTCSNVWHLIS